MKHLRRAVIVFASVLSIAAPAVGTAAAAPVRSHVDTATTAAACPQPGVRVKLSYRPEVYLIDPEGDLNWIPNATVYNSLFDNWLGILEFNNLFTECYAGRPTYVLHDGHLAKTSSNSAVYIYQDAVGGYRKILNTAVFEHYRFSWTKVKIKSSISPMTGLVWGW